ncbi:hypothetical protein Tco_0670688, partial [Tanacetum coccineum]
ITVVRLPSTISNNHQHIKKRRHVVQAQPDRHLQVHKQPAINTGNKDANTLDCTFEKHDTHQGTKRRTPRTQAIQQLHSNGQEAMIFNIVVNFDIPCIAAQKERTVDRVLWRIQERQIERSSSWSYSASKPRDASVSLFYISLEELQELLSVAHLLPANNSVDEVDSYMYQSLKMVQERQLRETEYDASPKHLKLVHVGEFAQKGGTLALNALGWPYNYGCGAGIGLKIDVDCIFRVLGESVNGTSECDLTNYWCPILHMVAAVDVTSECDIGCCIEMITEI